MQQTSLSVATVFEHQMFAYLPRILHGIFLSFLPAWMMVMMWFVAQFIHHMHAQAKILVFSLCWWDDKRVFVLLFLHSFPEFSYYIFPSFWSFDCDHHVVCYSVKLWYWNEEYLIKAVSLNQKSGLHDENEKKSCGWKTCSKLENKRKHASFLVAEVYHSCKLQDVALRILVQMSSILVALWSRL